MDKTLESTLKAGMNTKLPTCDDKGVLMKTHQEMKTHQMMKTHQETQPAYGG